LTHYSESKVVQLVTLAQLIKINYAAVKVEFLDQFVMVLDSAVRVTQHAKNLLKTVPLKTNLGGIEYTTFVSKAISEMDENNYQSCHTALLEMLSPCFHRDDKGAIKSLLIYDKGPQVKVVVSNPCKQLDPRHKTPYLLIGPVGTRRHRTPDVVPSFLTAQKKLTDSRDFRGKDEKGLSLCSTNHRAGVRVSKLVRNEQRVLTTIMALGPCDVALPKFSSIPRLCSILDVYSNECVRFIVSASAREGFSPKVQARTILMPDKDRTQVIFCDRANTSGADLAKVMADDASFWFPLLDLHPKYVIVGKCFSDAVWKKRVPKVYRLDSTHAFDCVVTNVDDFKYAATRDQKTIFSVTPDGFDTFESLCATSIADNDLKNAAFLRMDANCDPRYNIFRPSATYLAYCMDELNTGEIAQELDLQFVDDNYNGQPDGDGPQLIDDNYNPDPPDAIVQ